MDYTKNFSLWSKNPHSLHLCNSKVKVGAGAGLNVDKYVRTNISTQPGYREMVQRLTSLAC